MAEILDFGLQRYRLKLNGVYNQSGLFAVVGDTARCIEVQLLDAEGRVTDTTGIELSLSTIVGQSASYVDADLIDASKGLYQINLANGLFLRPGNQDFQWTIRKDGKKINSVISRWHIHRNVSDGGNQSFNFYINADDLKRKIEELEVKQNELEVKQDEIKVIQADMEVESAAMISKTESIQQELRDIQQAFVDDTVESEALRISVERSVEERYSNLEADYAQDLSNLKQSNAELTVQLAHIAYNVKTFGAKGDGVTDDTDIIQSVIDTVSSNGGGIVLIPNGTYMIKADKYGTGINLVYGIKARTNVHIKLLKGAILKAIPNSSKSYTILQIKDVDNVIIEGGIIQGEKLEHVGTTGEWGHGVSVINSKNVTIKETTIKNCFGDGIYIKNPIDFKNVLVDNVLLKNCRRHELTVIECSGFILKNSQLIKEDSTRDGVINTTHGGLNIDIESNHNTSIVENVLIENNEFSCNTNTKLRIEDTSKINRNIVIKDNRFNCSDTNNMDLYNCENITVVGNKMIANIGKTKGNLRMIKCKNALILDNVIDGEGGFHASDSTNVRAKNNIIKNSTIATIHFSNVNEGEVSGNEIDKPGGGGGVGYQANIVFVSCSKVNISKNVIKDSMYRPFYIIESSNITMDSNNMINFQRAGSILRSQGCIFSNNNLVVADGFSIFPLDINNSQNNLINGNKTDAGGYVYALRVINNSIDNLIVNNLSLNATYTTHFDSTSLENTESNNIAISS